MNIHTDLINIRLVNATAVVLTVALAVALFTASGRAPVTESSGAGAGPVALVSFY